MSIKEIVDFPLPDVLLGGDTPEALDAVYAEWKEKIPLTESQSKGEKKAKGVEEASLSGNMGGTSTLTSVMLCILAFPIESKSPME